MKTSNERMLSRITELEAKIINEKLGSESDECKEMMRLSKSYNQETKPFYFNNNK